MQHFINNKMLLVRKKSLPFPKDISQNAEALSLVSYKYSRTYWSVTHLRDNLDNFRSIKLMQKRHHHMEHN